MGFFSLLKVASMPIIQVLIICVLGAFMATDYLKLLPSDARKSLNKIVFTIFTPSLIFASLAKTVQFKDIISWWFMPVSVGLTFVFGGTFGCLAAEMLRLEPHVKKLIIALCATGNLGNIIVLIIPAICKENGNPFGDKNVCSSLGLSYASLSMALGAFYTWTYSYGLIQIARELYRAMLEDSQEPSSKEPNIKDLSVDENSHLLNVRDDQVKVDLSREKIEANKQIASSGWNQILHGLHQLGQQLLSPPVFGAILGFIFGSVTWLRNLITGDDAPLRALNVSVELLGDGTIPCITLILGGNLTQGLRNSKLSFATIISVICIRYVILPVVGLGIVQMASYLGFLPSDPLFRFVLMIQFALPPAMNIGTMTQLFEVAEEECSVIFFWSYLVATFALTGWSTMFMWILS